MSGMEKQPSVGDIARWAWRDLEKKFDEPMTRDRLREAFTAAVATALAKSAAYQPCTEPRLEPVHGDVLPPIGTEVLIHLASLDKWVAHRVVGYYAWPDLKGNASLHRVFVRVVDRDGCLNARLLRDIRPVPAEPPAPVDVLDAVAAEIRAKAQWPKDAYEHAAQIVEGFKNKAGG